MDKSVDDDGLQEGDQRGNGGFGDQGGKNRDTLTEFGLENFLFLYDFADGQ